MMKMPFKLLIGLSITRRAFFLFLWGFAAISSVCQAQSLSVPDSVKALSVSSAQIVGTAYASNGSGEILYKEYHFRPEAKRWQVVYKTVDGVTGGAIDGEIIADKSLQFGEQMATPAFTLHDYRFGEVFAAEVTVTENGGEQLVLQRGKSNEPDIKRIDNDDDQNIVIDAGFDEFIRQNWQPLLAGDTVRFEFAYPKRLTTLSLQVQLNSDFPVDTDGDTYFRMIPSSGFLRLWVDPIYLSYQKSNQRLRSFHGVSNLYSSSREAWPVTLHYQYQ